MSDASLPKAPDSEKGKQVREQYFALAKSSARGVKSYEDLYQRYVGSPNAAQALDQEVARAALKSGSSPPAGNSIAGSGTVYATANRWFGAQGEESRDSWTAAVRPNGGQLGSAAAVNLEYACAVTGSIQKLSGSVSRVMSAVTSRRFSWIRR